MDDYKSMLKQIKEEYGSYQKITEHKIQELSTSNIQLEKNLDMLTNIILITNYINSNLSNKNIIQIINDMIIGIIGVTQSTIYLFEDFRLVIKATNGNDSSAKLTETCKKYVSNQKTFIINSKNPIVKINNDNGKSIHSRMGVPIKVGEKFMGYIVVDHAHYNFLTEFHEIFLTSIASQIGIAIENAVLYKKIKKAAKSDSLLGIYNRKTFFEVTEEKLQNSKTNNYAIVMVDIDNFKMVNDTLGHQFGDLALIETVNIIRSMLLPRDVIARYGGEEIILYIECNDNFNIVYERIDTIRKAIANNVIVKDGINKTLSASFGLGFYPSDGKSVEDIIKIADQQLYKAKNYGKNRVMSSQKLILL